jgi:hypothetical protein
LRNLAESSNRGAASHPHVLRECIVPIKNGWSQNKTAGKPELPGGG